MRRVACIALQPGLQVDVVGRVAGGTGHLVVAFLFLGLGFLDPLLQPFDQFSHVVVVERLVNDLLGFDVEALVGLGLAIVGHQRALRVERQQHDLFADLAALHEVDPVMRVVGGALTANFGERLRLVETNLWRCGHDDVLVRGPGKRPWRNAKVSPCVP